MHTERPYFAHSTSRPDRADWQSLREHLHQVADLARDRAAKFDAGEWGTAELGEQRIAFIQ